MTNIKFIISVVLFIIAIGGAIFAAEDRYVTDKEASKSLEMFNQKMDYEIGGLKSDILRNEYEFISERYFKIKQLLFKYPNDLELQIEYAELKDQRAALKDKVKGK